MGGRERGVGGKGIGLGGRRSIKKKRKNEEGNVVKEKREGSKRLKS